MLLRFVDYLAGVGCSDGLARLQSQLADTLLTRDDEMSHNEAKGAELRLARRQGRADRQ